MSIFGALGGALAGTGKGMAANTANQQQQSPKINQGGAARPDTRNRPFGAPMGPQNMNMMGQNNGSIGPSMFSKFRQNPGLGGGINTAPSAMGMPPQPPGINTMPTGVNTPMGADMTTPMTLSDNGNNPSFGSPAWTNAIGNGLMGYANNQMMTNSGQRPGLWNPYAKLGMGSGGGMNPRAMY